MIRRHTRSTRTDTLFPDSTLFRSHVQRAAVGVFQVKELHFAFAQVHIDQSTIPAYAVLRVHDGVSGAQFRQVAHHRFDVAAAFLGAPGAAPGAGLAGVEIVFGQHRSEEHTSELQSLMRISYAVFCLTKKKTTS